MPSLHAVKLIGPQYCFPQIMKIMLNTCKIPNTTVSDRTAELTGKVVHKLSQHLKYHKRYIKSKHHKPNLAKRHGRAIKHATAHTVQVYGDPFNIWYYAPKYMALVQ